MEKQLPSGTWLYFRSLSVETTDVTLQEFLASRGIDLPLENISVRLYPDSTSAKVTITREVTEQLVNWAIDGQKLNGRDVQALSVVKAVREKNQDRERVGGRDFSRTNKNRANEYRFEEQES